MATATIIDVPGVESKHPRGLPPPPPAFRTAARSFRCLSGVDVVWLAVRESRSQTAVICCSQGSRSVAGLGMRIEPGGGVGGALLVTGEPGQFDRQHEGAFGFVEVGRWSPARSIGAYEVPELLVKGEQIAHRIPSRRSHVRHRSTPPRGRGRRG